MCILKIQPTLGALNLVVDLLVSQARRRATAIYRDMRYIAIFFVYRDMRYIAIQTYMDIRR